MVSQGRVLGTSRIAVNVLEESGDQQDSCTVSRKGLGTSRIAGKALRRVWEPAGWLYSLWDEPCDQQDSCEVSWRSLGNSRIAVKSLGRVWETSRMAL